jgi:hypothetical protein
MAANTFAGQIPIAVYGGDAVGAESGVFNTS